MPFSREFLFSGKSGGESAVWNTQVMGGTVRQIMRIFHVSTLQLKSVHKTVQK